MADESDDSPAAPPPATCTFFRRPSAARNLRKRPSEEEEEEEEGGGRLPSISKKSAPTPTAAVSSSFHFESSKEIQVHHDSRATATLETETPFDRDARALRERVLRVSSSSSSAAGGKIYRGAHAYTDYTAGFRRENTVSAEKAGGAHGPLRASAHIRASARFDYQPDICKDYKETGYCGFGDACKFMHDRGDYKSGWQLEREWDEAEKAHKRRLAAAALEEDADAAEAGGDAEEDEDELPFACFICRQPFEDPVVTKCKHYFCEHCALKHHSKNKKCFVCNQPTLGIFNTAHEIRKRMALKK